MFSQSLLQSSFPAFKSLSCLIKSSISFIILIFREYAMLPPQYLFIVCSFWFVVTMNYQLLTTNVFKYFSRAHVQCPVQTYTASSKHFYTTSCLPLCSSKCQTSIKKADKCGFGTICRNDLFLPHCYF